jgi:hypothetical protein
MSTTDPTLTPVTVEEILAADESVVGTPDGAAEGNGLDLSNIVVFDPRTLLADSDAEAELLQTATDALLEVDDEDWAAIHLWFQPAAA